MARKKNISSENRKPDAIDEHVGKRIRMRRSLMGLSQETLGEKVGLTFQQIQKYEGGSNRVSAGRLYQFMNLFGVDAGYFFEGLPEGKSKGKSKTPKYALADNDQDAFIVDDNILYSKETLEVIKLYYSVENEAKRKELFRIFRSIVDSLGS